MRISSNPKIIVEAVRASEAVAMLGRIVSLSGHKFWPDEPEPANAPQFKSLALIGHRQVTDAYLLALAAHNRGKLATFDSGILDMLTNTKERTRYVHVIG
jgi:predicted nucleic acid-binding protein